jgi:hypothetical protein
MESRTRAFRQTNTKAGPGRTLALRGLRADESTTQANESKFAPNPTKAVWGLLNTRVNEGSPLWRMWTYNGVTTGLHCPPGQMNMSRPWPIPCRVGACQKCTHVLMRGSWISKSEPVRSKSSSQKGKLTNRLIDQIQKSLLAIKPHHHEARYQFDSLLVRVEGVGLVGAGTCLLPMSMLVGRLCWISRRRTLESCLTLNVCACFARTSRWKEISVVLPRPLNCPAMTLSILTANSNCPWVRPRTVYPFLLPRRRMAQAPATTRSLSASNGGI